MDPLLVDSRALFSLGLLHTCYFLEQWISVSQMKLNMWGLTDCNPATLFSQTFPQRECVAFLLLYDYEE